MTVPLRSFTQLVGVGLGSYALHITLMQALAAALYFLAYTSQGGHGAFLKLHPTRP